MSRIANARGNHMAFAALHSSAVLTTAEVRLVGADADARTRLVADEVRWRRTAVLAAAVAGGARLRTYVDTSVDVKLGSHKLTICIDHLAMTAGALCGLGMWLWWWQTVTATTGFVRASRSRPDRLRSAVTVSIRAAALGSAVCGLSVPLSRQVAER
jgi:hypothetical protein